MDTCRRSSFDKELSAYIWNDLLPNIDFHKYAEMKMEYRRKYAREYSYASYPSSFMDDLLNLAWVFDEKGNKLPPSKIYLEDLSHIYHRDNGLIEFLRIEKHEKSIVELGGTVKQQEQMEIGKEFLDAMGEDVSMEEALNLLAEYKAKKRGKSKANSSNERTSSEEPMPSSSKNPPSVPAEKTDIEERLNKKWEQKAQEKIGHPHSIGNGQNINIDKEMGSASSSTNNAPFFDEQKLGKGNTGNPLDVSTAERRLKTNRTEAQEGADRANDLVGMLHLLNTTSKYTYKWFKLLMELMNANESNNSSRQVQIDFMQWDFTCSDKILHLYNPSMPIPDWCGEADEISITAITDKPYKIEGCVAKSDNNSIDLSIEWTDELRALCNRARKIRVNVASGTNIINSLEKRFLQLGFADDFDMNANLPHDMQFIYGPPGTGKTTRLVKMVHDLVKLNSKINILVLTPTNKAADVVAEKMVDDGACYDYVTRFGTTESLRLIEDAAIVLNRDTMDMNALDKNIVVTTAARYAYDYLQPDSVFLCDYPWDYIVVDEASMVDLITITYILYKGKDAKFIISGDPMQLPPVQKNNMPEYNIYSMVELNDFANAVNDYTRFPVTTLKTQHRSIPSIGNLVSKFAYCGLVKADSERAPRKPFSITGLKLNDINFVGYDVEDFNPIKELGAINGSAFQLYAVIFTYNMVQYAVSELTKKYPEQQYTIGIVCPYRAEADAISQMIENRSLDSDNCHVICGTVHRFQGDECDIMFVVLNPPAECTSNSHINRVDILNVAMSRARDYLFFILPNGQPKGFTKKNELGHLLDVNTRAVFNSHDIERIIFGDANYIESNTHVTCHMPVNVYCEDTAMYEVRISDDALDIKMNVK
jgi:hypothetical protein